ncbi:DUF421 domain-containing protein [Marinithermofilum abyssi]|uniref:DUF421 domain-containing protein n=1 Tax=Marinithermofilum abyssi TaxID=1571185 RepID=A0A8J2VEP9_9BACL|nr:DUF421 domain-containing protein [Marinithermofilum abyssi]GGE10601.1 DUF421 domain-containing protein [Marinithermofilum abyssi]
MFEIIWKTFIMFILTVAVIRTIGKSAIVQLTPYDLVAIVIIGTVAAEPLISTEIGPSILTLGVLTVMYLLFAQLTLHHVGNSLFLGKPTILIKKGEIVEDHLEKNHVSVSQLLATLRASGYPDVSKIDYAILEPIGQISIIPKPEITPLSAKDIGLELPYEGLPIAVIVDGQIQKHNLRIIDRDEQWLDQQLKKQNVQDTRRVLYAFKKENQEDLIISLRQPHKLPNEWI